MKCSQVRNGKISIPPDFETIKKVARNKLKTKRKRQARAEAKRKKLASRGELNII